MGGGAIYSLIISGLNYIKVEISAKSLKTSAVDSGQRPCLQVLQCVPSIII
jgi:hypothetical protein